MSSCFSKIAARFVSAVQGLNHLENITQLINNISQYKIYINGNLYSEYLQTLNDNDFKKKVILKSLCNEPNRLNGQQLLRILFPHSKRLPAEALMAAGDKNPDISGMSYNSARDELFLADNVNEVVHSMRVRDNAGDLCDVYTTPLVYSVCHMSDSDTLLVCSGNEGPDRNWAKWLVALRRNGSSWRVVQRVQTDISGHLSFPLSGSRLLIGEPVSKRMELFRVESGPRISRVHCIHVPEEYAYFSATCDSDTRVAMTYSSPDNSVRVHRLLDDRLEEIARIGLKEPWSLLWLADRLVVADFDNDKKSHALIELKVSDTRLERRCELFPSSENIYVHKLCAVNDGLAMFNSNSKDILLISKEVQSPLLQQSLEKRCEKHHTDKESTTEMYNVHCFSAYFTTYFINIIKDLIIKDTIKA